MRALIPLLSYAAIPFLVAPSSAYYIDPASCAAVHDKIVTSMTEIFSTISPNVRDGITANSLNDLFGFIFGTRAGEAKGRARDRVFSADRANTPGLATLETAMNNNQVRFFCDEKRYVKNTDTDSRRAAMRGTD
ncbi:MAG: hypothetical protein M1839_009527 [Geoglossum umbratile]|nr:MAG: hypothetical protein M1839_009527 [Geoglossum umbratile]